MSRYVSDQNKIALLMESGTYGVSSGAAGIGQWPGEVIEHSVTDSENLLADRFLGASTRSVSQWAGGPRDVEGTLTLKPQDMRFMFWAIGSVNEVAVSGNVYAHYVNQTNTDKWQNPFVSGANYLNGPISWTLEDSKVAPGIAGGSNFVRTVKGCVANSVSLTLSQGEKATMEVNYIAQNLAYSGGATPMTLTASTYVPYLWNNSSLVVNAGSILTAKEISLEVNNNIQAPHYLNGSRDISTPILGNRDSTLSITLDLDSQAGNKLYEDYKANTTFNCTWNLNQDGSTGSQHTIFLLSGCKINKMEVPSVIEGPVESTVEIVVPIIIGSAVDNVVNYNPY